MEAPGEKPPIAWQPFTGRGVAAFAQATFGRLLLVQFLIAVLVACGVVWFVHTRWFSVTTVALDRLPAAGEIRFSALNWPVDSPQLLAENRFLAIIVDLRHEGNARSPAHVQVEFGRSDLKLLSLFGSWQRLYPAQWRIAFNRPELKPWWDAWSPALLAGVAVLVITCLLVAWAALASIYFLVAWLIAFYTNRALSLWGSWKTSGAALLPGAVFMLGALVLYGFGLLDLVQLIAATAFHFVLGWIYLVCGALAAPPLRPNVTLTANPFLGGVAPLSENEPLGPAKCEAPSDRGQ